MSSSESRGLDLRPGHVFSTTHWSVVLTAADTAAPGAAEALEKLCQAYWHPIYSYVRRLGHGPEDAQDLAQAFFEHVLTKKTLKLANPGRGRFRTFLLACLKNFVANARRKGQACKRGGRQLLVSLDQEAAENQLQAQVAAANLTPDQVFDQRWALTLLDQVLARLREEFGAAGKLEHFEALRLFVWGDRPALSQAAIAGRLGTTESAVAKAVERLRRRYGELLREAVALTVDSPREVEAELRYLLSVVSG